MHHSACTGGVEELAVGAVDGAGERDPVPKDAHDPAVVGQDSHCIVVARSHDPAVGAE